MKDDVMNGFKDDRDKWSDGSESVWESGVIKMKVY